MRTGLHSDGAHEGGEASSEAIMHLTRGYGRDHRPGLNQGVAQFICENEAGIPVLMKALSGNGSGQADFRQTVATHVGQLKTDVGPRHPVTDSALHSAESLRELDAFGWVSRVPETLGPARELTLAVTEDLAQAPEEMAYRSACVTYGGIRQRWVAVHTQAARQRAEKTLRKQHPAQGEAELKAFARLQKTPFACEADVEAALRAFRQRQKLTQVCDAGILACPRHRKQGRPRQGRAADARDHFIQGGLASRIDRHRQKLHRKSAFVVATNELDDQALPDERVIELYRKDQQKVERGFRFLKDPLFAASTLFLKTPRRIMALLMVMTVCLLVYAAIEWRVRQALQLRQSALPDQKGRAAQRPTARWVFQFFSAIRVLKITDIQTLVLGMNQHHRALLNLLGSHYVELYANSA